MPQAPRFSIGTVQKVENGWRGRGREEGGEAKGLGTGSDLHKTATLKVTRSRLQKAKSCGQNTYSHGTKRRNVELLEQDSPVYGVYIQKGSLCGACLSLLSLALNQPPVFPNVRHQTHNAKREGRTSLVMREIFFF